MEPQTADLGKICGEVKSCLRRMFRGGRNSREEGGGEESSVSEERGTKKMVYFDVIKAGNLNQAAARRTG